MTTDKSRMITAAEAWGDVPDWIAKLVEACEAPGSSQNKVAKRLGYTGSVVSQVIRDNYPGRIDRVEQAVRDILMPRIITCPALSEISTEACHEHRARADRPATGGPLAVHMRRACRACPRYQKLEEIE